MKSRIHLIPFVLLLGFTQSCNNEQSPETLESKKVLLDAKKKELATLQIQIDSLTSQISDLDPSLKIRPKYVGSSIISLSKFERYVNIQGNVIADEIANVVSEVPGRIVSLTVKEGDAVRKGQVIARLDLDGIQKQIAEIETSLGLARDLHARQERLWSQNIGSEVQYLQAKNNVERLEKSLETVKYQLTKSTVYSPLSGVIDKEMLKLGELASPGMPIVQILNTSNLKIVADLPERYLPIAKKGMIVDLFFPTLQITSKGRIHLLGRSIDPANRTLAIEVISLGSTSSLKPNLLAELRILELTIDNTVLIPVEYILQEVDGTEYVYVATRGSDNQYRAQKKYIKTGEIASGNVIVTEGLSEKEELVTKGTRNISDGELLEIINDLSTANGNK